MLRRHDLKKAILLKITSNSYLCWAGTADWPDLITPVADLSRLELRP